MLPPALLPTGVHRAPLHPIDDLIPYPGNARRGNVDLIVESLQHLGRYRPIVVQKSTRYVPAGNHSPDSEELPTAA